MGLLRRALQKRRGRRDFGPPMGRPRMVPNIPAPIPPLEPFERLPFDDPRNDFMSIQRIEDVGVPGITPIEPVIPTQIPMPITPVLPPQPPSQIFSKDPNAPSRQILGKDAQGNIIEGDIIEPIKIPPFVQQLRPPLEKLPIQNIREQQIFVPPRTIVDRELPREVLPPQIPVEIPIVEDDPIVRPLPVGDPVPFVPSITPPSRDDFMSIGGPGGGITSIERISEDPRISIPQEQSPEIGNVVAEPVIPAPTTPAAVADNVGAVPPTTIPADTRGQIDPVLAQQDAREVLSDPLLRALYFGTADQPGFINQLQQATQNVMGAELPSTQFDPNMTQQFFNPFEDRVVQQTIQDVMDFGEKQDVAARARDIQTGGLSAFGSRARLTADERREALGRGLAESLSGIRQSGFSEAQRAALGQFRDQYERQMGQINRPIDLLTTVGRSLPGYGAQQTVIDSQYRLPVDPTAAGLGAAFNTYAALTPKTGAS